MTTNYETAPQISSPDVKCDLRHALGLLGFTAIQIKSTPQAADKIRWQADCLNGDETMIIHGMSFMTACVKKGMTLTHREGCVWQALTVDHTPTIRQRTRCLKPAPPVFETPQEKAARDVIPWPWESVEQRARHCADFLRAHRALTPDEHVVAMNRIARIGVTND